MVGDEEMVIAQKCNYRVAVLSFVKKCFLCWKSGKKWNFEGKIA